MCQSQQSCLLFSSAGMFKKPVWQTVWTQITLFASLLNLSVMLSNYLQQTTFQKQFFLGALWVNSFLENGDLCRLLKTFANSLDPDQDWQNVGPCKRWLVSSAANLCKQFGSRSGPTNCQSYMCIQTVWHSDSVPEEIFEKVYFEKNQQTTRKAWKITQHAKSISFTIWLWH